MLNRNPIKLTRQPSPLKIWRLPQGDYARFKYFIGADPARGQEKADFAAAIVWCGETGEQVARYANRVNPEALAHFLNFLGRFYNTAMIAVELTGNLGLWTQSILRDRCRYSNLYRWKGRDDRQPLKPQTRSVIGWETNVRTRDMLMTTFRTAVTYGRAKVRDTALVAQMEKAERSELATGRWDVKEGHDDILMAAMIGWIAREQWYTGPLLSPNVKRMLIEPELDIDLNPQLIVPTADVDVATALQRHWARIQQCIRRHGKVASPLEGI